MQCEACQGTGKIEDPANNAYLNDAEKARIIAEPTQPAECPYCTGSGQLKTPLDPVSSPDG